MKRPLLNFTVVFMLGLVFNKLIPISVNTLLFFCLTLLFLVVVEYLRKKSVGVLLYSLIFLVGAFWHQLSVDAFLPVDQELLNREVLITGTILKEPELKANHIQYQVKVQEVKNHQGLSFTGKLIVKDYEGKRVYAYGDRLSIKGKITVPQLPTNPGAFNYEAYLRQQGIAGTVNLWQSSQLKKLDAGENNAALKSALKLKENLVEVTDKTLKTGQAQLLQGILFGTKGQVKEEILEIFRQVGVAHILAVSGLHVGIVSGGIFFLGALLGLSKRYQQVLVCLFLVLYAFMTGLQPSVIRATVMGLVLILGAWGNRERDWSNSLALAALVLLISNPLNFWHIGFQLSFVATWSILYLVPVLNNYLPIKSSLLKNLISVPLAAQLGTWPVIAYYFNIFSGVSIVANIVLVQIVAVILLLGLLAALLGLLLLPLAEIINVSTGMLIDLLVSLTTQLNELPGAYFFVKSPPLWLMIFWYGGIFLVVSYVTKQRFKQRVKLIQIRHSKRLVAINSLLAITLFWHGFGGFGSSALEVTFLDVGQGDSAVIKTPAGKRVVIDAAGAPEYYTGSFNPGAQIISPYLKKQGLNKIDVLILTHPHQDHVGGALALLQEYEIGLAVLAPVSGNTKSYEEILKFIEAENIPVAIAEKGDLIEVDQATQFLVLHPNQGFTEESKDLNNNSVVVKLLHGQNSFLFTGDIEEPAINELLKFYQGQLKSDVLKIPHHGSATSLVQEFYEEVMPDLAVISVGQKNRYGHPNQDVLKALKDESIAIYRTDQQGAITIHSDGIKLEVESQKGVH